METRSHQKTCLDSILKLDPIMRVIKNCFFLNNDPNDEQIATSNCNSLKIFLVYVGVRIYFFNLIFYFVYLVHYTFS